MTKHNKLINRFSLKPKDFTWMELVKLLNGFGYELVTAGKTSGSRMRFIHDEYLTITLHKPHPEPVLKRYQIEQICELLKLEGLL